MKKTIVDISVNISSRKIAWQRHNKNNTKTFFFVWNKKINLGKQCF